MIKQVNGEWCLFSKDGLKNLGCFKTEEEAKAREKEVQAFRHQESIKVRVLEATGSKDGSEWDVVLIESGLSENGVLYSDDLLAKSVPQFNGAKAYAYEFKGDAASLYDHLPDNVREAKPDGLTKNLVGEYVEPRFGEFSRADGTTGKGVVAKFRVMASWLRDLLKNAWEMGTKDIVGFSIDAVGAVKESLLDGKSVKEVTEFSAIDEVTVVTEPGAGGRLLRLVASQTKVKEYHAMDQILKMLREKFPRLVESVTDEMTPEEKQAKILEALAKLQEAKANEPDKKPDEKPAPKPTEGITRDAVQKIVDDAIEARTTESSSLQKSREVLEAKLTESKLPDPVQDKIKKMYWEDTLSEEKVNRILQAEQDTLARMQESKLYVPGQTREEAVNVNKDEQDKHQKAFEGMLANADVDGVPRFRGLHESYRAVTGASGSPAEIATGIMRDCAFSMPPLGTSDEAWRVQLQESRTRFKESTLQVSTWAQVFGDSVRRRLIAEYADPQLQSWRLIVSDIGSAPDFRTNRRQRVGGFGNLSTVAASGTYPELTWPADEEVAFAVAKRGGLAPYEWEAVVNDDLGALRRMPKMLGRSAIQTLHEFVFDFIADNATMDYDSVALFHANHSNLGSTAFSDAALDDRIFAMADQTELTSSKPIGMKPKYILVPNELMRAAWEQARADKSSTSGRTETVENWFKTYNLIPINVAYWTDANNWYLVADPAKWPTMEIDFLNGREEPEIFIQDQPTIGSVFTADKITYKIRHIYGGDVLDHRSFDGSVVT